MPASLRVESTLIALAMMPVGLVALAMVVALRRCGWPRWVPRNFAWHGVEAVPVQATALLTTLITMQTLAAQTGRKMSDFAHLGICLALPATFLIARLLRVEFRGLAWQLGTTTEILSAVRLGAMGFLIVIVPTYLVHFAAQELAMAFGLPPVDHAYSTGPQSAWGGWFLYAVALCFATPWIEELISRGIVLPWATRHPANSFVIISIAGFCGFALGKQYGLLTFLFVALVGLIWFVMLLAPATVRIPRRTLGGILASSVLFAALHANVWPTPLPLMVLACGLGYVAARSGGIVAPTVLHILFNTVAVIRVAIDPQ